MSNEPITVSITSGKGGVGKTSLAVNLALALVNLNQRVLIVDGDMGLANVDIFFGLAVNRTIREIFEMGGDPAESLCFPEERLGVLPAASGVPEMVSLGPDDQRRLGGYLTSLFSDFDYVLIDTAAGIGSSVLWFNGFVHHSIVVCTPEPTSITDAYALIKVISARQGRRRFHIAVNQAGSMEEAKEVFLRLNNVTGRFLDVEMVYLGAITSDPVVSQAIHRKVPFVKLFGDSPAAQAVTTIAGKLMSLVSL
jgi:flagellar biosynthesis protein FlhG